MDRAMIRDILVPYVNEDSATAAMPAALALAESFDAGLALLVTVEVPLPMPTDWGAMAFEVYAQLHADARALAQARADALRARFAHGARPVEVRMAESWSLFPQNTASMHAHYADLVVLPGWPRAGGDAMSLHDHVHDLLRHGGRPLLVVPAGHAAAVPPKRALIAWSPTREAARAVADAMPLLRLAETVEVVVVDPRRGDDAHGAEPGANIAAHLARHGLRVTVSVRTAMNFSVAYAVLDHARDIGADLLVAGGYGHSRLRESVLGGTTRELLQTAHLPVLFAH